MKIKALSAMLAKRIGIETVREIASTFATLGEVDSREALEHSQALKREWKAKDPRRGVLTYSIVARDAETGELGAAIQSRGFTVQANLMRNTSVWLTMGAFEAAEGRSRSGFSRRCGEEKRPRGFVAIWDDVLRPLPEEIRRENLAAVKAALRATASRS
jgi:hypothetical protein